MAKEMGAHRFPKSLDNMGGSAFRNWTMLFYRNGVFVGFHNHDKVELYSIDPNTKWQRGCQDSCCHGDCWPSGGRMSAIKTADQRIKPMLEDIAKKSWEILEAEAQRLEQEEEKRKQAELEEYRNQHEREVSLWQNKNNEKNESGKSV
jgi:hypothetical protein